MPIFTSLLFFFLALALWPLATRNSGRRELRRRQAQAQDRFETAAQICEAAARDAFHITLDHSLRSIDQLDEMIDNGWSNVESQHLQNDTSFVMGAYLGDVFVRNQLAEWTASSQNMPRPFLYFPLSKKTVSPFDIIEQKLNGPSSIHLPSETARWQSVENTEPGNDLSAA